MHTTLQRPRWTLAQYLAVHLVGVILLPSIAWAGDGRDFAHRFAWEIIVLCAFSISPVGAWLGASTPPPDGYEAQVQGWGFRQQLVGGTVLGWLAAALAANYLDAGNPLIVAATFFAAFGGAGLLILIRRRGLDRIDREIGK